MNNERKITKQLPRNYIFEGYDLTEILVILHESFDKDYFTDYPDGTRSDIHNTLVRAKAMGITKITVQIYRKNRLLFTRRPRCNGAQFFHYRKGEGLIQEEGE